MSNQVSEKLFTIIRMCAVTAALATLAGCGKKDAAAPATPTNTVDTAAATGSVEEAEAPLIVPAKYTGAKQERFASLFKLYADTFKKTDIGAPMRIERASGLKVDGDMVRITDDALTISTPDGPVIIPQAEMTDASRETVFISVFAERNAERQLAAEAGGAPADPITIFFKPKDLTVREVRRFNADRMNPRYGPGRHYAFIEDKEIFRGQNVFVIDEEADWICVKESADAQQTLGWIPRFASFITNPENKDAVTREIKTLMDNGFIVDLDTKRNEALVDYYQWRISDIASIEGKSRLMAIHCGQQRGVRLYWVDVKDALTGRKLADYSESKGFKVY